MAITQPGIPQRLDDEVTRIVAPNGGLMTGAGTNTYLVGTRDLVVIDPGPDDESHIRAVGEAAAGSVGTAVGIHGPFEHD